MTRTVAILGAGIGEKHLAAYLDLRDRFTVTHICDLNTELAQRLASQAGAETSASLDDVIADPAVDVVDICLPPPLHVPVTLKALAQDKHVIVEKPIAGSLRDADRLAEAEAGSKGRIFPVFQYRFGRAFEALAQLRRAGLLSRPLTASLETHWNRGGEYYANPWRGTWEHEFGGVVLSHAIHAHDLLVLAFGPVAEVSASLATRVNPIETEDCAAIAFRMKNGATATSSITLGAADDTSRLRLIYDDMTVESTRLPYTPGEATWTFQARDPNRQDEIDRIVAAIDCPHEGFAGSCAAVADALDGRTGAEVSLNDAIASIELAAAIYHSDRSGQRVTVPIDRSLPICDGFKP
ncbi:Gfo/Idh/MocA family protein [Ruegeria hyattellae]|uniref:Gfo/Idh/MocA family protein n=1 Tax=Ruegeria hyattellae TaxID=3233337 RepID=UPI00355B3281